MMPSDDVGSWILAPLLYLFGATVPPALLTLSNDL